MNNTRDHPQKKRVSDYLMRSLIFLLILSLVGLLGALFNRSSDTSKGNSATDSKEVYKSFGGNIIKYWDFEELTDTEFTPGVSYTGDNIKIAPKASTISFSDGKFSLISDYSCYTGTTVDGFAIFGYGTQTYFDSFSYYMIDADITTSASYPFHIRITPDFRNDDYTNLSNGLNSELCYYNKYLSDRNGNILAITEDDSFHLTYIFDNSGVAYIYIDGSYIGTFTDIYKTGTTYCDGFKITSYMDNYIREECFLSVDNVVLTSFATDYEGPITSLLDDCDVNLSNNSDTFAYQERFGYTPQILYSTKSSNED